MHTSVDILNEISRAHGDCSDYRIAKLLNTPQATVSNWRTGRRAMSPDFGPRLASLLDWDAAYVMACLEHERVSRAREDMEGTGEILSTWERIADKFRPHVPAILAALLLPFLGGISAPAQAVARDLTANAGVSDVYIMRSVRRSRRRRPHRPVERITRWFRTEFPIHSLVPA